MKSKILIIEDDKFLAELIVKHIVKESWEADLATDGEGGLAKARSGKPDLILLDLVLPGIDGYEVLTQLKADSGLAKVPVLILSNLGQREEIDRGLSLGAEDFLVKARLDLSEITAKVKEVLEKRPS